MDKGQTVIVRGDVTWLKEMSHLIGYFYKSYKQDGMLSILRMSLSKWFRKRQNNQQNVSPWYESIWLSLLRKCSNTNSTSKFKIRFSLT